MFSSSFRDEFGGRIAEISKRRSGWLVDMGTLDSARFSAIMFSRIEKAPQPVTASGVVLPYHVRATDGWYVPVATNLDAYAGWLNRYGFFAITADGSYAEACFIATSPKFLDRFTREPGLLCVCASPEALDEAAALEGMNKIFDNCALHVEELLV